MTGHPVTGTRADRPTRILLATAALWGVGLVIAAAVAPAYRSTSASSSGTVTHTSATLVQENGVRVLAPVSAPLLAVGAVTFSLWHRRRREQRGAGTLAWTVVALLGGFTLLAMLSIGVFILPVVVLVAVACARA